MSRDKNKMERYDMLWMGFIHQIDDRKKNKQPLCDFCPLFIFNP